MINTIFYFVDDENFDYGQAVDQGAISPYTIVFDKPKKKILMGGKSFGQMSREDIAAVLLSSGDISDLLPVATDIALGGIKIGYVSNADSSNRKYGVKLDDNNRAYVQVPWTDTITPEYDDSELRTLIQSQRTRIDNYINNLTTVIQQKTEQLLDDAEWVTNNLESGETGRQIIDDVDRYMRQYGVWEWVDPNDESKGRIIKTSAIEQTVDSIDLRVGAVETYKDGALATALSNISQTVGVDLATGQTIANTGLTSSVADLNAETGAIDRAIIAALDLKAKKQDNTYEAITDLSSVYSDNTKSLYSGLENRVSVAEGNIQSEANLMARVVNNDGSFTTDALAGIASSTQISGAISTARSSLIADINNKTAGITVMVTKNGNTMDSSVTLSADQVYINGNTTVAGKIQALEGDFQNLNVSGSTTTNNLSAVEGRVTTLESDDVTIKNRLTAAEGNITTLSSKSITIEDKADTTNNNLITLTNGNGTFTGNVNAKTLIAGDPNGINIRTSSDKIEFCQGGDVRAYFISDNNGMQLHVWDSTGVEHYIDFTKWTQVGGSTYTPVSGYQLYNGSASSPFVQDTNLYKGSDGKYYTYSGSSYSLVTSRQVYVKESANSYPTSGNGFSGSYVPVIYAYSSNNGVPVAISVNVDRYIKYTITNGEMGAASSDYTYHCPNYPVSVSWDTQSTYQTISTAGRFVNPSADSAEFQYRCINGTLKNLGQPMPTYTYVSPINSSAEYSTNPTVYDVNISA